MRVLRIGPPTAKLGHQRVVLDGGPSVRLRAEDVAALGLAAGSELDAAALARLREAAEATSATEIALRLLAVRLRSRREIEVRLRQRGIQAKTIRDLVLRLESEALLDDYRFSRAWVEGRQALRPSGALRLRRELMQKGVATDLIDQVLRAAFSDADEHQLAVEFARARMRRYRSYPPDVTFRRLAGVLHRRGFSAAAVARALREVLGRSSPVAEG